MKKIYKMNKEHIKIIKENKKYAINFFRQHNQGIKKINLSEIEIAYIGHTFQLNIDKRLTSTKLISIIAVDTGIIISKKNLRKGIQYLRENTKDFFESKAFIVANVKGYKLSTDFNECNRYRDSLYTRQRSLNRQILEIEDTIIELQDNLFSNFN